MSKLVIAACAAALVAGCATPMTYDEAYQVARGSADWELCYVSVSGRGQPALRQAVNVVMSDRRTNCNQHVALVTARMRQDAADRASSDAMGQLGLQMMRAAQPRPAAPGAPTECRSYNRGGYVQTVCD